MVSAYPPSSGTMGLGKKSKAKKNVVFAEIKIHVRKSGALFDLKALEILSKKFTEKSE